MIEEINTQLDRLGVSFTENPFTSYSGLIAKDDGDNLFPGMVEVSSERESHHYYGEDLLKALQNIEEADLDEDSPLNIWQQIAHLED